MTGVARQCLLYSKMVDSFAPISIETALALKSARVDIVGRYIENLSAAERDGLFTAGLGILPLSMAPVSPISEAFGHTRATHILERATALGVPTGVHLMVDLEEQHGSHADATAYDKAITAAISGAGFVPLAYVGAGQLLSGAELYALPNVHLYWRGGSRDIPDPTCGFAIWQIPPLDQTLFGMLFDMSMTGADLKGRSPIVWYSN
jgi:hypothetical protein